MTISVVQTAWISAGFSGSFASNVTIGNSIVIAATGYNGNNGTAISSSGLLYNGASQAGTVKLTDLQSGGGTGSDYLAFWLIPDVQSSAKTLAITMTNSLTGSFVGIAAWEVSGLGASPALDQSSIASGGTTAAQSSGTTGAITGAPEFIAGALVQDGTPGTLPGSPWSANIVSGTTNTAAQSQIVVSSGGTYAYNVGAGNANWVSGIVTVKAAGSTAHTDTGALTVTPGRSNTLAHGHNPSGALTVTPTRANTLLQDHGRAPVLALAPAFADTQVHAATKTPSLTVRPVFANTVTGGRKVPGGGPDRARWWK